MDNHLVMLLLSVRGAQHWGNNLEEGLASMWLLILAIVILILSAFQMSYYVVGSRQGANRPYIFYKHAGVLICSNTVFLIAGFTMLFIAAGWKWGLGGLVIYWVLVSYVLNPIIDRLISGPPLR